MIVQRVTSNPALSKADWTSLPDGRDWIFLSVASLAIFAWSWISSFALAELSGKATWLTGLLFYMTVVDAHWFRLALHGNLRPTQHSRAIELLILAAARLVPQGIARPLLFILPAVWGLYRGLKGRTLGIRQPFAITFTLAVLTLLLTWISRWYGMFRAWGAPTLSWTTALLSLPLLYVIAMACRNGLRRT